MTMMPERPRILIVEDSPFITLALEALCDSLGWELVGPAHDNAGGLTLATGAAIDVALLDLMLGDGHPWGIAAALQARGVPFLFITGHHDPAGLVPAAFKAVTVVRKPFRLESIAAPVRQLLAARGSAG